VQRATPVKKPEQRKREFFVREVAEHLRATTKAKTWSDWELDENFEIFCNQVHTYEIEQSLMRWLECENRATDTARQLMKEERSSSGPLSFSQARAILVEHFSVRIENDAIMKTLSSYRDSNISRARHLHETYKRLAGPTGYGKSNRTPEMMKRHKIEELTTKNSDSDASKGTCLLYRQ
jgi:hypothetical protein